MLLAVHYRVMEHLGSLESTQEARVALGYRLGQLLRFFRAFQTSRVLQNSIVKANCLLLLGSTCNINDKNEIFESIAHWFWTK